VWTFFSALTSLIAATICSATGQVTNANDQATPRTMEPVTVFGKRASVHDVTSEADLVGPAHQPEWTTRRAFAETDIYVIPPGEIEFNQFYISSHPRHGKPENLFESEFEFGLPWRTQFDVEPNYSIEGEASDMIRPGWKFLTRWRTGVKFRSTRRLTVGGVFGVEKRIRFWSDCCWRNNLESGGTLEPTLDMSSRLEVNTRGNTS